MKRTLHSLFGIAAGLLFVATGCKKVDSNDLKESVPYYQEYTVTYDMAASNTRATALIRVREKSGTKVDLTSGAYIYANGVEENDVQPTSNSYNWLFPILRDVRFDLKKNSGAILVNTIAMKDIGTIDFETPMKTGFSKNDTTAFMWVGDDLVTDESVVATISGKSVQSALVPWTQKLTVMDGKYVVIYPADVKEIAAGAVTIKLERIKNLKLDTSDSTAGGNMKVTVTTNRVLQMAQ